jgi:pimeloyl-ACP methyl ester carboxylesterase
MVMRKQILILLVAILSVCSTYSQNESKIPFKSEFVEVNGIKTHYLDFGGEGLSIILVHSEGWDATTYKNFGPLLNENNRVFAVTRSGYGDSEVSNYQVESQGDHLIGFMNVLGIEKAVFIGNSSVSKELTYLAENYPKRLAGIVYLSGIGVPWLDIHSSDPTRAHEMYLRVGPSANSNKIKKEIIQKARASYRPLHFNSDTVKIGVPAMAFVANNGRQGHEEHVAALLWAGSPLTDDIRNTFPPSALKDYLDSMSNDSIFRNEQFNNIQDSVAREYFVKLSRDTIFQKRIQKYHIQNVYPATIQAQDRLINAYGDNINLVKLDVQQIVGYEYRDTPKIIIDHIRNFLKHLQAH